MSLRILAKDTVIYGLSSIVGRFLNWLLVPLYTHLLVNTADYGVITNLYAWTGLLLVLLTYGLETGFFRYANKPEHNAKQVFSTTLIAISVSSLIFATGATLCLKQLGEAVAYEGHADLLSMMLLILVLDLVMTIPFCYLRFLNRPIRFAALKMLNIGLNIGLNLFFLLLCPVLHEQHSAWVAWFYTPGEEIRYIIVSNLIASATQFLAILPVALSVKLQFDFRLLREMMNYSFPLLILGLAGMMNQSADKILLPILIEDKLEALSMVGIYSANFKIAVIMVMFAQAFRFAYEPYFFAQSRQHGVKSTTMYADAMKYFVLFGLVIFLGVVVNLDIIKFLLGKSYYEGLQIVPLVLTTELLFGIFFNLSVWYKLTDQTRWGAYFSVAGAGVTVIINILLVPHYGYWGCAWAGFISYFLMTLASYFVGRNRFPIPYDLRKLGLYTLLAAGLYILYSLLPTDATAVRLGLGNLLLLLFVGILWKTELRSVLHTNRTSRPTD